MTTRKNIPVLKKDLDNEYALDDIFPLLAIEALQKPSSDIMRRCFDAGYNKEFYYWLKKTFEQAKIDRLEHSTEEKLVYNWTQFPITVIFVDKL